MNNNHFIKQRSREWPLKQMKKNICNNTFVRSIVKLYIQNTYTHVYATLTEKGCAILMNKNVNMF